MIRIATLREYLDLEMRPVVPQMRMRYDLERVIDDYVFLCIFVGNDFLPSLPLLDIREGAVTMLLNIYRRLLPTWNDYIIRPGGEINYMQVQTLMREVYENERNILRRKRLFGKYTVGNLQRPSEKDESAKEMEMGEEDSVTLVNLFIKTMVDSVAKSGNKNVDYVKTIQVWEIRFAMTCRFDLRLRQLVKQYFDNVPKNDVSPLSTSHPGRLQPGQLGGRLLPEEDGHRADGPRVDRARLPGVGLSSSLHVDTCWASRGSCSTTARAASPGTGSTRSTTRHSSATSPP